MINPEVFYNMLKKNNIDFFTGVPDSLLKDICAYITDNTPEDKNIIAANEGNAIALAAGYYLGTGKIGLVYMQNSGIGNATNPLLSLMDPKVYSIPVLLVIGWRGEPRIKDEPQHMKQGQVTLELLDTMGIKYEVLSNDEDVLEESINKAIEYMKENKAPYALVIKKNTFSSYKLKKKSNESQYELTREKALEIIIKNIEENSVIVSTTGKASRELYELREQLGQTHERDFLTVGSMGHSLSIATGIALSNKDKQLYCIDGDGALLMHMGGLAIVGSQAPKNLSHIVINNGAHDSVGGQPTVGYKVDMKSIATACGYELVMQAETGDKLKEILEKIRDYEGLSFLEIKTNTGSRKDLGRPRTTPIENKDEFMRYLGGRIVNGETGIGATEQGRDD